MAPQHLALLDDALSELREAYRRFAAQSQMAQDEQTVLAIAPAIRSAYLATEKLLKHALATLDPYLVYEELRPVNVRSLIKDLRATGSPSPLASRTSVRTLTLADAWVAVQELDLLPIDSATLSQFGSTVKQLTAVRRQAQHAELWSTPLELLSLLEQLFAQIRVVGNTLVPGFDKRLSAVDAELPLALQAIEQKVDKGWVHLRELVALGTPPLFEVKLITSLKAADHDPELVFLSDNNAATYIFGVTLIPRAQAPGLFTTFLDRDQTQAREDLMTENLPIGDIPESDIPSAPPPSPLGLLGFLLPEDAATKQLQEALRRNIERKRIALERFGLKQLEDSGLSVPRVAIWGHWVHPDDPKRTMISQLLLQDFDFRYRAGERTGHIHSRLVPNPTLVGAAKAKPLQIDGPCWMTGEFVTDERTASEIAPVGTVLRFHRARLQVKETWVAA